MLRRFGVPDEDWPSVADYVGAIRDQLDRGSTATPFHKSVPYLRLGDPVPGMHGDPNGQVGNFGYVCRIQTERGLKAVKCFTTNYKDRRKRYKAISRAIPRDANWAPHPIYVDKGIWVRGRWWPIVVMPWLESKSLGSHLGEHCGRYQHVERLARSHASVVHALREHRLGAAEVNGNNVRVSGTRANPQIVFIDVDSWFAPRLQGVGPMESANFEFGCPTGKAPWNRDAGNFAHWMIQLSLLTLCAEPQVWDYYGDAATGLVFRLEDYSNVSPEIFAVLGNVGIPEIGSLATALWTTPGQDLPHLAEDPQPEHLHAACINEWAANWVQRIRRPESPNTARVAAPDWLHGSREVA